MSNIFSLHGQMSCLYIQQFILLQIIQTRKEVIFSGCARVKGCYLQDHR